MQSQMMKYQRAIKISLLRNRGAALIVALFVMSLVAITALLMIQRLSRNMQRTHLLLTATQAELYTQGGLAWAVLQLNDDLKKQQPNTLLDAIPLQTPTKTLGPYTISTLILEPQGRFNLNNLTDPLDQKIFLRLLQQVAPKLNATARQNLLDAVIDWISHVGLHSEFDEYYQKLNPPYWAPHRLMASVSELRLVKGMTPQLYAQLLPHIIALPQATALNINHTTLPVLMSLSPDMSMDAAKALLQRTQKEPFVDTHSVMQFEQMRKNNLPENKITVQSEFFLVQVIIKSGTLYKTSYTLLQRTKQNSQPHEIILWHSQGTL